MIELPQQFGTNVGMLVCPQTMRQLWTVEIVNLRPYHELGSWRANLQQGMITHAQPLHTHAWVPDSDTGETSVCNERMK